MKKPLLEILGGLAILAGVVLVYMSIFKEEKPTRVEYYVEQVDEYPMPPDDVEEIDSPEVMVTTRGDFEAPAELLHPEAPPSDGMIDAPPPPDPNLINLTPTVKPPEGFSEFPDGPETKQ